MAIFSAAIVIGALGWISTQLPMSDLTTPKVLIIRIVTATGFYYIVFRGLLWLYFKWLWRFANARTFIGGIWRYHYNEPFDPESQEFDEPDKMGQVRIEHSVEDIAFYGESADPKSNETKTPEPSSVAKTVWNSTSCALNGSRLDLSLVYSRTEGVATGSAILYIVTRPSVYGIFPQRPVEIHGHYIINSSPNDQRYGRVVFLRINHSGGTIGSSN